MDWSEIIPLTKYEAESLITDYCNSKGYSATKIPETSVPEGYKVPDLVVKRENKVCCLVEIKAPEHNLNPHTKLFNWNTVFNKLRGYTRTATKQLKDYDSNHTVPWILAITSNHPQLNWTHYRNRISNAVIFNGTIIRDFNPAGQKRIVDTDVMELDMTMWFQVNYVDRRSIVELKLFLNSDSKFIDKVEEIANTLKLKIRTS